MPVPILRYLAVGMLATSLCVTACRGADPNSSVSFEHDVLPILREYCWKCHGATQQESNYRLDQKESAFRGGDLGEAAIIAGDSQASPLFRAVAGLSPDLPMPPPTDNPALPAEAVQVLQRWIDAGAEWPQALAGDDALSATGPSATDHWAFQPLHHSLPPQQDPWQETNIDRFILARLREVGLSPSPPADRTTWIRRLYLDLLGLPPTPDEVQAFVADQRADAYDRLIDATLARPQYGERWAQHWLDVVRYGETDGFETNRERERAYPYRDYVVSSLNRDTPYNQFIVEQLAGDAVGCDLGTGFLVAGPHDIVKSPDPNLTLMQRQDELADLVNTTGATFLGLTVGCARCHNHKFDPIQQTDYYAMQAVFAGVQHGERSLQTPQSAQRQKQMAHWQTQRAARQKELQALPLRVPVNPRSNTELFAAVEANYVKFSIFATTGGEPCIDELEVFSAGSSDGAARNVALSTAGTMVTGSGTLPGFDIHQLAHVIDGRTGNSHSWISDSPGTGWVQLQFAAPVTIDRIVWGRDREGGFHDRTVTRYQFEVSLDGKVWTRIASSDDRLPAGTDPASSEPSQSAALTSTQQATLQATLTELKQIDVQLAALQAEEEREARAFLGTFGTPPVVHRLHRGDPMAPREVVLPDTLQVLGKLGLASDAQERDRRLLMARSIAAPTNPLTARVIVNRLWQYHFGNGIVATPSDFGKQGIAPTHPELLDYLADYLIRHDWSLKALHRHMLTSQCYRQSNRPRQECLAKDADCRLWWRFPPRRLEAESIRDSVLAVSGTLNLQMGGHGFYALQVIRENVHHYYPKEEFVPGDYRRMLYAVKIRQERDGEFGAFDCPDGGQVVPRRSRSTTPLQAMNLLNSRFMWQQAVAFAERIERASRDEAGQVQLAYQHAYGRHPDEIEHREACEFVDHQGIVPFCLALLNSNEMLFIP